MALQDTFLSYNILFILDFDKKPDLIRDEDHQITYALIDVIDVNASSVTLQDDPDSGDSSEEEVRQSINDRLFY
jgi:hypothetical protein